MKKRLLLITIVLVIMSLGMNAQTTIDWANLQWPASGTINPEQEFFVYSRVYVAGITDQVGEGAAVTAWIGYSTENTNPNTWNNWVEASYSGDDGTNNDEYSIDLGSFILTSGTYYYAARFQVNGGDYYYGGFQGGKWDDINNISGELTVNPYITFANLQWPESGIINQGSTFDAFAQVYAENITTNEAADPNMKVWIGYSVSNDNPANWDNWIQATFSSKKGNNHEYSLNLGEKVPSVGTYYYASRFQYKNDSYVYGGYSGGYWDGTTNVNGELTINHANGDYRLNGAWEITENWDVYNGTDWNTASQLPISTSNIYINAETASINSATEVVVNNLTVFSDKKLTIKPNSQLTTASSLTNRAVGGIVLESSIDNGPVGSLKVNGTISGAGTITAERYIAAYTTDENGWHLFSSPFDNFNVAGTNLEPSSTLNEEDDLYYWDEAEGDFGTWMNWKASNFNLDAGKGYLISSFASETKSWTGVPYHADKTFTNLSYTNPHPTENNTWHLLGNPFMSAITWNNNNGWSLTNIGGVAKVMNVIDGSYIDINVGGVIPAFQGFFVSAENSTNTITISRDARSHETTNYYKSSGQYVKLSANDVDKGLAQESNLFFGENGSEEFDYRYDSRMLPLYAPGFYSVKSNQNLSTNSLPLLSEDMVIPFGFETNGSSNFEIELKENSVSYPIFLTDNLTGTIHKLSENPIYSFTSTEGDSPNRFLLHFGVVGIGEQDQTTTLNAYAYNNRLYVNNSLEKAQLAVYDLQGRLLMQQSADASGLQSLPLDLPAGVYVVRLSNAQEAKSVKINVQ